jgi:hypothetical protein
MTSPDRSSWSNSDRESAERPKAKDVTGALRPKRLRRTRNTRPTVTVPVSTPQNANLKKPNYQRRRHGYAPGGKAADVTAYIAAIALVGAAHLVLDPWHCGAVAELANVRDRDDGGDRERQAGHGPKARPALAGNGIGMAGRSGCRVNPTLPTRDKK